MEKIIEIDIDKIKLNSNQPRKEFNKEKLRELANSIKERGLINPIQVKKSDDGDFYELICGERRLKAHKLAHKKTIKAIIRDYSSKSDEMIESLIENLHREGLNSTEKENFITALWELGKYKGKGELAKAIGVTASSISTNLIAKIIREETSAAKVSTRNLSDIQVIKNTEDRKRIIKKIEKGEINSEEVRGAIKIISKSPIEVKEAFFLNEISIEQASKISKIKDNKIRGKMILAHKNIRNIDKSIEKNFEKISPKNKGKTIRIKEVIENFRNNAIENQKITQRTIKSLMVCMPFINLMDDVQLKKLEYFQELLEMNLTNALELLEKLKEKIVS